MNQSIKFCYKCDDKDESELLSLFGYTICQTCKKKMGLFTKKTVEKYIHIHEQLKKEDSKNRTYEEEVLYKLDFMKKDYISKKIKLLDILDKIK